MLRYRSNLLGADLRITNFGGGNTSSKIELPDPFTGQASARAGGEGQRRRSRLHQRLGFALLYLDRLEQLKELYRGEEHEDEMVGYYPLSAFGQNRVAASIDTPLHAFLPFRMWTISIRIGPSLIAASANGKQKLEEFNRRVRAQDRVAALAAARALNSLCMLEKRSKDNPGATASCSAATACSPGGTRSASVI